VDIVRRGINRAKLTEAFFLYKLLNQKRLYRRWGQNGHQPPVPHIVKQRAITEYAERFRIRTFVETGTYLGEMVYAMKGVFGEVFSIELGEELARSATKRFAPDRHVTILQGNNADVLKGLLPRITTPTLFWLDAHYSGGTTAQAELSSPLEVELSSILAHPLVPAHAILIDDAQKLGKEGGYPPLETIQKLAHSSGLKNCIVKDDIVRLYA
jgi:hypothetical protein